MLIAPCFALSQSLLKQKAGKAAKKHTASMILELGCLIQSLTLYILFKQPSGSYIQQACAIVDHSVCVNP